MVRSSPHGTEAIDAFIYDDNGQLYISWKAYGLDKRPIELLGCKLSADGLHLEGEPFSLLVDDEESRHGRPVPLQTRGLLLYYIFSAWLLWTFQ